MTKKEYARFVRELFSEMESLIVKKNSDYAEGEDPFSNFRIAEQVNVDPLVGLFIRMEDKNQRIRAYLRRGDLKVTNEGIEDAFKDLIGYSCLALGMLSEDRIDAQHERKLHDHTEKNEFHRSRNHAHIDNDPI